MSDLETGGDLPVARIDTDPRGGPVRTIINGRHIKPTGRFASSKNGRSFPWEAEAERDLCVRCEADPDVATFLTQPHRLTMPIVGGRPLVYFPDMRVDYVDGTVEIIEVKRRADRPDPAYAQKIKLASRVYAGVGYEYRVVLDVDIEREPHFGNARAICADRFVAVSLCRVEAAATVIRRDAGRSTRGEVTAALGGGPQGTARLNALIVQRFLWVDLGRVQDDEAAVWLASARPRTRAEVAA